MSVGWIPTHNVGICREHRELWLGDAHRTEGETQGQRWLRQIKEADGIRILSFKMSLVISLGPAAIMGECHPGDVLSRARVWLCDGSNTCLALGSGVCIKTRWRKGKINRKETGLALWGFYQLVTQGRRRDFLYNPNRTTQTGEIGVHWGELGFYWNMGQWKVGMDSGWSGKNNCPLYSVSFGNTFKEGIF